MQIKNILVCQATPKVLSPYENLSSKYGVSFDYIPFFKLESLSSLEMRSQRCNPLDYDAVVFSSRSTIDAFFSICEELRINIPESMKYFCTNEKVAMYLQKHVIFRKRKIFFGDGTPASVLNLITAKHKSDNFLIVTSDSPVSSLTKAFDETPYKHTGVVFAKSVPCDLSSIDINSYDMIVTYNKQDIISLKRNFPGFEQGSKVFITFGGTSLKAAMDEAGFEVAVSAPSAEYPSAAAAIESYLKKL